jgi:hypothetical protein
MPGFIFCLKRHQASWATVSPGRTNVPRNRSEWPLPPDGGTACVGMDAEYGGCAMSYDLQHDIPRIIDHVQEAPSIFNTRPWWFKFCPDSRIELWLRGNQGKPQGAGQARLARARAREYVISCGAALFDLRMTLRAAGHDPIVWLLPDPKHADPMNPPALLASVEIITNRARKPSIAEQELYEAIGRRHTNRWPYILPVPLPIIAEMEEAAAQEGAYLRLLHRREAKRWMNLTGKVDRTGFVPPFTNSVNRQNYGPPPKNQDPRTRKDFRRGVKRRFERKPQLMALSTDDDEPVDWLRAGQALQRALLTGTWFSVSARYGRTARYHAPARYGLPARRHLLKARAEKDAGRTADRYGVPAPRHLLKRDELARYGMSASPLTQPLEWEDIQGEARRWPWRWRYAELPQMIVRVGYAAVPSKGETLPQTHMNQGSQPAWEVPPEALVGPDSPQPLPRQRARRPWAARSRRDSRPHGVPRPPGRRPRRAAPRTWARAEAWMLRARGRRQGLHGCSRTRRSGSSGRWSPHSGSPILSCPGSARPAAAPARTGKRAVPGPGGPHGLP